MGNVLRKLDLVALTASGKAAEKLHEFLVNMREDVAAGIAGGDATIFHKRADDLEVTADASDLPTVIALANALKATMNSHLASNGLTGFHATASAETIVAVDASSQGTANTLLNELKADYNTHLSESGVHLNNDGTNAVSSADAADLGTSITLANEIKADFNAHAVSAMSTPAVEAP